MLQQMTVWSFSCGSSITTWKSRRNRYGVGKKRLAVERKFEIVEENKSQTVLHTNKAKKKKKKGMDWPIQGAQKRKKKLNKNNPKYKNAESCLTQTCEDNGRHSKLRVLSWDVFFCGRENGFVCIYVCKFDQRNNFWREVKFDMIFLIVQFFWVFFSVSRKFYTFVVWMLYGRITNLHPLISDQIHVHGRMNLTEIHENAKKVDDKVHCWGTTKQRLYAIKPWLILLFHFSRDSVKKYFSRVKVSLKHQ